MDMVDIANATLSGGVAVGAVADLMLGPAGAFAAGTVMGLISTLGFQKLQSFLHDKLKYVHAVFSMWDTVKFEISCHHIHTY